MNEMGRLSSPAYKSHTVEVSVVPILLGGGVPLVSDDPSTRIALTLTGHRVYAKTGMVSLVYAVNNR